MPAKKKSKSMVKKKRKAHIRYPLAFPRRAYKKFVYIDTSAYTAVAGNDVLQQWRLNSIYDPDFTSIALDWSANQFKQLFSATGPYVQFQVVRWRVTHQIQNNNDQNLQVAWTETMSSDASYDLWQEVEYNPRSKIRMLSSRIGKNDLIMKNQGSLSNYSSYAGVHDTNYDGTYNANPVNPIFGTLLIHDQRGSAIDVTLTTKIEFDVICHNTQLNQAP